ncbi:coproporphyrinogen III oxidase family protein [Pseudomonas sp. B21-015]|uniref:coproporphyrinogen-III oxidase family protein n=1 Tax=Pseudomonas sp. B21-015 TaxID=2895473 RepID=UPI002160F354|nr:coproporphyrinogen-III oxidase family protein [Pseudomonas sp. B21-015]UVM52692.1 coproporphyrinogen III oxidase family protein [Pseudomonas sp. B21-015]
MRYLSDVFDKIRAQTPLPLAPRNLQIYIHVPFCTSKCHFCDYVIGNNTRQLTSADTKGEAYVDALCRQIKNAGQNCTGLNYVPTSIYWGGGTPTRLNPYHLERIMETLQSSFDLSKVRQHSLEASPETLSVAHLRALDALPVDRVSLGIQSFDKEHLRRAGRAHSAEQAVTAVDLARSAGVPNVNIDLIAGFPDEEIAQVEYSIARAVALDVQHISVYPYRPSPGTKMANLIDTGRRGRLSFEHTKLAYQTAKYQLEAQGFEQYCLAYFAREKISESIVGMHTYGLEGDILGLGSGAHSMLGGYRVLNDNAFYDEYIKNPLTLGKCVKFGVESDQIESLMTRVGAALQTKDGLNFDKFEKLTGLDFKQLCRDNLAVRAFMKHLKKCGGTFYGTEDGIALKSANIHEVYIQHLYTHILDGTLDRGLRV